MIFEWDPEKAAANLRKHHVSFHDAATVFADPLSTTYPDPDHSEGEARYLIIGASESGALLVIAHNRARRLGPDHQRETRHPAGAEIS